ncbi:MAG: hypothetical protein HY014_04415 [Acidobacteria bacterium]|nr:hypothetical protein [Acidobacteriota bacterium]MBI3487396.1 hypothetical protein [Acidobacteriota bacterium]
MKIAFPTMDGQSISAHFGRSKSFLVLEIQGAAIRRREVRVNEQARPVPALGHDHAEPGAGPVSGNGPHGHDHGAFARLLEDCQVLVVRGMGAGAVQAIRQAGRPASGSARWKRVAPLKKPWLDSPRMA